MANNKEQIRVHSVSFHDKTLSELNLNICSRHIKQTTFSGLTISLLIESIVKFIQ